GEDRVVVGGDSGQNVVIAVGVGGVVRVAKPQTAAERMAGQQDIVASDVGAGRLKEIQGPAPIGGHVNRVMINPIAARAFRAVNLKQDDARGVIVKEEIVADD